MNADQAMQRWRCGHHVFFVLIQGIILAHRQLKHALERDNRQAIAIAFTRAARLFNGSSAAMRFAGDMPAECYDYVRQSMSPPNVPEGFTGMWSIDHSTMMNELKALRQQIDQLDDALSDEWQSWRDALDIAYTSHAYVCERFVGDGPSLVKRPNVDSGERSAVESLETFRQRALARVSPGR